MSLEFIYVGHGPVAPQKCVACDSYKDLTDTHREIFPWGRVYLCDLCITRLARARGLVEGPEQDAMLAVDHRLKQAETELQDKNELIAHYLEQLRDAQSAVETVNEEKAFLSGRIAQLEARIRAHAEDDLALVGAGVIEDHILYGNHQEDTRVEGSEAGSEGAGQEVSGEAG